MPVYYTYKDNVPLKPGQTLGFAAGKGYYAAGTPEPTSASHAAPPPKVNVAGGEPAPPTSASPGRLPAHIATDVSGQSSGTRAVQQPVNAAAPQAISDVSSSGGYVTSTVRYYSYRKDVPLKSGETVGFTRGRGYYAVEAVQRHLHVIQPTVAHPGTPNGNTTRDSSTSLPTSVSARPEPNAGPVSSLKQPVKPTERVHVGVSKSHYVGKGTYPTSLGNVVIKEEASAKLEWSGGAGKLDVSLENGHVSVSNNGLTLTDPGNLHLAARGIRNSHATVRDLWFQKEILKQSDPYYVDINVGSKTLKVPVKGIESEVSLKFKNGYPIIDIATSANLETRVAGGTLTATYTITTTITLERRFGLRTPPDLVPVMLAALSLVALSLLVGSAAIPKPVTDRG